VPIAPEGGSTLGLGDRNLIEVERLAALSEDARVLWATFRVLGGTGTRHSKNQFLRKLGKNPHCPGDLLEHILVDAFEEGDETATTVVMEAVERHKSINHDALLRVAEGLVSRPLSDDRLDNARVALFAAIAGSRKTPPEMLSQLGRFVQSTDTGLTAPRATTCLRVDLAKNRNTPVDTLRALVHQRTKSEAAHAIANKSFPLDEVVAICQSDLVSTSAGVGAARRDDLPDSTVLRLLEHGPEKAQTLMAAHPAVPEDVLAGRFLDPDTGSHTLSALAANPRLPVRAASDASHSDRIRTRLASTGAKTIPLRDLAALTSDTDNHIARTAAKRAPARVAVALGIDERNHEALQWVLDGDWGSMTPESPEVQMALAIHHNPVES
jgi:hypothetical protein